MTINYMKDGKEYLNEYDCGGLRDQFYMKKRGRVMPMPKNHFVQSITKDKGGQVTVNITENPEGNWISLDDALNKLNEIYKKVITNG